MVQPEIRKMKEKEERRRENEKCNNANYSINNVSDGTVG